MIYYCGQVGGSERTNARRGSRDLTLSIKLHFKSRPILEKRREKLELLQQQKTLPMTLP